MRLLTNRHIVASIAAACCFIVTAINLLYFRRTLRIVPVVPVTLISRQRIVFGRRLRLPFVRVTAVVGKPSYPDDFVRRSPQSGKRESIRAMAEHAREEMTKALSGDASRNWRKRRKRIEALAKPTRTIAIQSTS